MKSNSLRFFLVTFINCAVLFASPPLKGFSEMTDAELEAMPESLEGRDADTDDVTDVAEVTAGGDSADYLAFQPSTTPLANLAPYAPATDVSYAFRSAGKPASPRRPQAILAKVGGPEPVQQAIPVQIAAVEKAAPVVPLAIPAPTPEEEDNLASFEFAPALIAVIGAILVLFLSLVLVRYYRRRHTH
jgi:hypothetical protein